MIFDLLVPPNAPGGGDQKKNGAIAGPFMEVTHTPNLVEFLEFFFLTPPNPLGTPKFYPWGMTQAAK